MNKFKQSIRITFGMIIILSAYTSHVKAQDYTFDGGNFGLGVRSTFNYFPDQKATGMGAGGNWRLSLSRRVNTEWFLDYIQSGFDEFGYRKDYHIGWSVQFALPKRGFDSGKATPYILGGQCFDLTKIGLTNQVDAGPYFSAAAQAGLGLSKFIAPRFETNLQAQYMIHLTKDVHIEDGPYGKYPEVQQGVNFAGHVLITLGFNYYLADFF